MAKNSAAEMTLNAVLFRPATSRAASRKLTEHQLQEFNLLQDQIEGLQRIAPGGQHARSDCTKLETWTCAFNPTRACCQRCRSNVGESATGLNPVPLLECLKIYLE